MTRTTGRRLSRTQNAEARARGRRVSKIFGRKRFAARFWRSRPKFMTGATQRSVLVAAAPQRWRRPPQPATRAWPPGALRAAQPQPRQPLPRVCGARQHSAHAAALARRSTRARGAPLALSAVHRLGARAGAVSGCWRRQVKAQRCECHGVQRCTRTHRAALCQRHVTLMPRRADVRLRRGRAHTRARVSGASQPAGHAATARATAARAAPHTHRRLRSHARIGRLEAELLHSVWRQSRACRISFSRRRGAPPRCTCPRCAGCAT